MALPTLDDNGSGSEASDSIDDWMMVDSSDESDEDAGTALSPPIPSAGSNTVVAFDMMKYVISWAWNAYTMFVMRA